LMNGLEKHVMFGRRLESYEVTSNGSEVIAKFDDGSTERGTILIGADGARSGVRRQFLPELTVLDTEGRAVFGRTFLTSKVIESIPKQLVDGGLCMISEGDDSAMRLFCESMKFSRTKSDKLGFKVPHDYVYWVLCFRKDLLDTSNTTPMFRWTGEIAAHMTQDLVTGWHATLRTILENQDTEMSATLAFLTCTADDFVNKWESARSAGKANASSPVSLLGDGAHPLPPAGGVGANLAFQEAADLYVTISDIVKADQRGSEAAIQLGAYEERMRTRAKMGVERSSVGVGRFFNMKPMTELQPAALWNIAFEKPQ
jgi:2-polyprenyl-6-methoxyphenol hydroxylase-like FAD-dependent oxidoreductase